MMSVINTETGMFNVSGTMPLTSDQVMDITELYGGTSIAAIALTVFNFFAAVLAIIFILVDNRRIHKSWKISPSNRIPLVLALAICISHVFFMMKAFIGLASFHTYVPPKNKQVPCDVSNQLGFWAIWAPLVTIFARVAMTVISISFHFDSYATWTEGFTLFMTAVISFVVYIPVRVIKPAHRCLPFVLVFLEQGQPRLAMAAVIILSVLLLLLLMGMLIVGYDTGMFKRTPAPSRDADAESGPLYVQSQHKRNPDRKLIYYGAPLAIQYALLLPNFILGAVGTINIPLNLMASVALHLDGVILLLQYLFIHRSHNDVCPHCENLLHPNDDDDVFRRGRVGQWWRRSMIDTRSFVTATRTAESKYVESKYEPEVDEEKRSSIAESIPPPPRPSMVQSELPDPDLPFLPRLTIRIDGSVRTDTPTSQWSISQDSKLPLTRNVSSPYRSLMRKSRETMNARSPPTKMPQEPVPPLPKSHPFTQTGQVVSNESTATSTPLIEPPPTTPATSVTTPGKLDAPSIRTLNSTSPAPVRSHTISGAKRQSRTTLLWPAADSPRNSLRTARSMRTVAEQFEENVSSGSQMKRTQSLRYYI